MDSLGEVGAKGLDALLQLGEEQRGVELLETASEHPAFEEASLKTLAAKARREQRNAAALDYLQRLRRAKPRDIDVCLSLAEVATEMELWPVAIEALRSASRARPGDPRPYRALIDVHLARGDRASAESTLRSLERVSVEEEEREETRRLRDALTP